MSIENEMGDRLSNVPQQHRVTIKARVSFMVDVNDPSASLYVYNEEHRAVIIATTWMDNEHTGDFYAGEEAEIRIHIRQRPRPRTLHARLQLAHRGSGLDMIDRFEGGFSFVVTAPITLGGLVDLRCGPPSRAPVTLSSSRHEHERAGPRIRVARAADSRSRRTHRRLAAVLAPHLQHRGYAVEAPLLRLSARLSVAAGQAATAVPRPVRVLHRRSRTLVRGSGPSYDYLRELSCLARSSCSPSSPRRQLALYAAWWSNETLVRKIEFPRMAIPLSVVLLALFNLGLNLIVVTDLHPDRRRQAHAVCGWSCR